MFVGVKLGMVIVEEAVTMAGEDGSALLLSIVGVSDTDIEVVATGTDDKVDSCDNVGTVVDDNVTRPLVPADNVTLTEFAELDAELGGCPVDLLVG